MRWIRVTVALVLASATATAIPAEIYRWTDAGGRVHYSDRAPDESAGAARIDVPAGGPGPDPELQRQRERSRKLLEVWDAERRERDAAAVAAAERAAQREQVCAQLRAALAEARRANFVLRESEDGARQVMAAEERERYERNLADALAEHCP